MKPAKIILALAAWSAATVAASAATTLLNVSYDVSREFYKDYNAAFAVYWKKQTGETIAVTMNSVTDVDQLARSKLIPENWAGRLPNQSVPYTSTILFIVRKGNPKGIRDWTDLVRPGVQPVIPNPKTSGNGRYSYLAAWGHALRQSGGSDATARDFVQRLFRAVPVLDTGGRGATTTFAQRGIGDVLLTFENEVALTLKEFGAGAAESLIVTVALEGVANATLLPVRLDRFTVNSSDPSV